MKSAPLTIALGFLAACRPSPEEVRAATAADLARTQTAAPTRTHTPKPTPTRASTSTPTPSPSPTPTPTRAAWKSHFQSPELIVYYPDDWTSVSKTNQLDPAFLVLQWNRGDLNIGFTEASVSDFETGRTPEAIEGAIWEAQLLIWQLFGRSGDVDVVSLDTIELDGEPAVRRIFSAPGIQDPSTIYHKMIVVVLHGSKVYEIVATARSPEALRLDDIAAILSTLQFSK